MDHIIRFVHIIIIMSVVADSLSYLCVVCKKIIMVCFNILMMNDTQRERDPQKMRGEKKTS